MPFAYDNSDDWPKEYLWTAPGAEVPTKFEVLDEEKLRYYLINFPGGTVRESGRVRRATRQRRRDLEAGVSADIAGTLRGRQERRRRIAAPAIEVEGERSAFLRGRALRQQIRALTGSGGLTAFRAVMREIDEAAAKDKNLSLSDLLETVGRTEEEGAAFVRTMAVNLGLDLRASIPVLQRGTPPYDYVIACLRIFLGGEDEYPPYAGPPAEGIVARENPWPGMAGSGRYPVQDFMFAPAPKLANWTSNPQYSYDQFYRPNTARLVGSGYDVPAATQIPQVETVSTRVAPSYEPSATASMPALSPTLRAKGNPRRRRRAAERGAGMTEIVTCRGVMGPHPKRREDLCFMVDGEPVCVECYHETLEDLPTISRKNPVAVPLSTARAQRVPWPMAQNAGPFLPEMYPYGMGGRPYTYALNNPIDARARRAAAEAGFTLRGTSWPMMVPYWSPEKNRQHAIQAVLGFIQMRRGNEKDYPAVLRKLASIYDPEFPANEEIWERYEDIREDVRERRDRAKGKKKKELTALLRCLPTMKTLSRVEPMRQQMMRAAANPFY